MNKEEITNELLARIYGAYMGCDMIMPKSGRIAKMQGVDFDGLSLHLNDGEDHRDFKYFPFQLLLTPLSETTEEDAIEVANMCGYKKALKEVKLKIGKDCCAGVRRGAFVEQFYVMQEVIDFLRSKGYDCGYGSIPSLIDAGIAITKSVNTKK